MNNIHRRVTTCHDCSTPIFEGDIMYLIDEIPHCRTCVKNAEMVCPRDLNEDGIGLEALRRYIRGKKTRNLNFGKDETLE